MNKFFVILYGVFMLSTDNAWATELKIKVNNIDIKRGGNIIVMIFGEEGFPKKHEMAIFTQSKKSQHEMMEFIFDVNVEALAVKVLHDENGDGKVTKNWTGIWPKEGLGFSNDQKISLKGAPKYKNSKLLKEQLNDGINISIIYP
ncbi:MAG: DUF2141 domain-containing protein [Gammaproteobacteria bacterium]|nr:DUF2141 domain-containing protein [Gammaproteobacteria bacterium]MCF6259301.1 DUF2141 domain-containing protein [Gammaproteobacteria bacterium]